MKNEMIKKIVKIISRYNSCYRGGKKMVYILDFQDCEALTRVWFIYGQFGNYKKDKNIIAFDRWKKLSWLKLLTKEDKEEIIRQVDEITNNKWKKEVTEMKKQVSRTPIFKNYEK